MSKRQNRFKKNNNNYDRGHNFTELMVKTIQLDYYFLIRVKKVNI